MYEEMLGLAVSAAKKAGCILMEHKNIKIESCFDKDIKLSSDILSESIIIEMLSSSGIPVLSEERGFIGCKSNTYWIIDPLDGSMNYYKGIDGLSCVSLALWEGGKPVLGVVNRFESEELYTGVLGQGAELNGVKIKPSETIRTGNAVMATGFPVKRDYSGESLTRFVEQVRRFKKVRMLGSAAIMASFVACGRIDAYFEEDIMLWDIAAAWAIAEAAGVVVYYHPRGDYKCVFRCFSTAELMEDFNAEGL